MPSSQPPHAPTGSALGTPLSPATPTGRAPVVSLKRAWATVAFLAFAAFIIVTGEAIPIGLLSHIAADLHRTVGDVGRVATVYALVVAGASVPLAHVTRRIPRRFLITGAMLVHAMGLVVTVTVPGFWGFLVGRTFTASSQGLFWAVVSATAAGLFPTAMRGKVVARLFIGPSVAGVIGLPSTTWLGQHAGWHAPFVVLACLGTVVGATLALLIPHYRPADGAAARGSHPNMRGFIVVLATTMIAVLGVTTSFTYVEPYLRDIAGFADSSLPLLFTVSGLAGIVASFVLALTLDRAPRLMVGVGVATVGTGWLGVGLFASSKPATAAFFCAVGLGMGLMVGSFANRILQVSPGATDIGVATHGGVYNLGTAIGTFLGASLVGGAGLRHLPVLTAAFVGLALVVWLLEPVIAGSARRRRATS